ncbi:MAG: C39 family peptidase [Elusimicrobiota bacterium]
MTTQTKGKKQNLISDTVRSVSVVHLMPGDFHGARLTNFEPANLPNGALKTVKNNSKPVTAVLISAPIKTAFPFTQALAGANASLGPKDRLELALQVYDKRGWSPWFEFGSFSPDGETGSVKNQQNRFGSMATDIINLSSASEYLRYRVTIKSAAGSTAFFRMASVTYTNTSAGYNEASAVKKHASFKPVLLNVPKCSQMTQRVSYRRDICSPTSVTMILNHFGIKTRVLDTASGVRDTAENNYGNWTFNTMYAGALGLYAWPTRFNSLEEARGYLAAGIPLAASVTFGPDELRKSPLKKTAGHLLVIKGFDAKGNVLVNDPAAADKNTVGRVYDRKEFAKAWLKNKSGTAYILAPLERLPLTVRNPLAELFSMPPDSKKKSDKLKLIESQILPLEGLEYRGSRGAWLEVAALEQIRRKNRGDKTFTPYLGWIEARLAVFRHPTEPDAMVRSKRAPLKEGAVEELSIGARVQILDWDNRFFARILKPEGDTGLIHKKNLNLIPINIKPAGLRKKILGTARQFLGDKYYWGGRSGYGIDCSGLVNIAYRVWGFDLPRNARDQQNFGRPAARKELRPADLIFSTERNNHNNINHVMLYSGGGRIIEATQDTGSVREVTFKDKFGLDLSEINNGQVVNGKKIYFRTILK